MISPLQVLSASRYLPSPRSAAKPVMQTCAPGSINGAVNRSGGSDTVRYAVPLSSLPEGTEPASIRATLYYQAAPPFYLQDRLCTAKGRDTERLLYMVGHLDLDGSKAEGWKFEIATTGAIKVPR